MSVVPPRELYFFEVDTNYNNIDGYNCRVKKTIFLCYNEQLCSLFPSLFLFFCSLYGLLSPKNVVLCIEIRLLPLNPLLSFPATSKVYKYLPPKKK